jgi:hypothetical protein
MSRATLARASPPCAEPAPRWRARTTLALGRPSRSSVVRWAASVPAASASDPSSTKGTRAGSEPGTRPATAPFRRIPWWAATSPATPRRFTRSACEPHGRYTAPPRQTTAGTRTTASRRPAVVIPSSSWVSDSHAMPRETSALAASAAKGARLAGNPVSPAVRRKAANGRRLASTEPVWWSTRSRATALPANETPRCAVGGPVAPDQRQKKPGAGARILYELGPVRSAKR